MGVPVCGCGCVGVSTIIILSLLPLCAVGVFPCHQPLGLLLSKGGRGIFNVRSYLCACCAHDGAIGSDEAAHFGTRKTWSLRRLCPGVQS